MTTTVTDHSAAIEAIRSVELLALMAGVRKRCETFNNVLLLPNSSLEKQPWPEVTKSRASLISEIFNATGVLSEGMGMDYMRGCSLLAGHHPDEGARAAYGFMYDVICSVYETLVGQEVRILPPESLASSRLMLKLWYEMFVRGQNFLAGGGAEKGSNGLSMPKNIVQQRMRMLQMFCMQTIGELGVLIDSLGVQP